MRNLVTSFRAASILAAIILGAGLAAPAPVLAYVLKRTESGEALRWREDTVRLCAATPPPGHAITHADLVAALGIAAAAWGELPGTPRIEIDAAPCEAHPFDGINAVAVVERWEHGDPVAVTRSQYPPTGPLLETDILIDANARLAMLEVGHAGPELDLPTVMTHELGHVLGLGESDDPAAVMWPRVRPGEYGRRELAPDDVDAALALYGGANDRVGVAYGCAATPEGRRHAGLPLLVLALLVLALRGRADGTSCRSGSARR